MAKYMLESPHTPATCLQSLDAIKAKGTNFLAKFYFGCEAGRHIGWAVVDAGSEKEAKNMLPLALQARAKVTKVSKFTPQQIKALHEM